MHLDEIKEMPNFTPREFDTEGLTKGQIVIIRRMDVFEQLVNWTAQRTIIAFNSSVQNERQVQALKQASGAVALKALAFIAWAITLAVSIYAAFKK